MINPILENFGTTARPRRTWQRSMEWKIRPHARNREDRDSDQNATNVREIEADAVEDGDEEAGIEIVDTPAAD